VGRVAHFRNSYVPYLWPTRSTVILRWMGESAKPVLGLADAITRSDVEAALTMCDPEIEFLSVLAVSGRAYRGHDGIRQYFDDVATAWEEWRVEVDGVAEAPDGRVAIVMTMHARGRESGVVFSERTGHVWTLRDGKLLRNQPYRDPDEALRAIGTLS
jgi:ketosteroid isomerase-like protein